MYELAININSIENQRLLCMKIELSVNIDFNDIDYEDADIYEADLINFEISYDIARNIPFYYLMYSQIKEIVKYEVYFRGKTKLHINRIFNNPLDVTVNSNSSELNNPVSNSDHDFA